MLNESVGCRALRAQTPGILNYYREKQKKIYHAKKAAATLEFLAKIRYCL